MKNKKQSKKPTNKKLMMVVDEIKKVYFIVNSFRKKNTIFRKIGECEGIEPKALVETPTLYTIKNETRDLDKVKRFIGVLDSEVYRSIKVKHIKKTYGLI